MTNPPEPTPRRRRDLDFDEWLAILVAFGVLGPILFWGLRPLSGNLALGTGNFGGLTGSSAPSATASPIGEATPSTVPAIGANGIGATGIGANASGANASGASTSPIGPQYGPTLNNNGLVMGAGLGAVAVGANAAVAEKPATPATPAPIETPIASPTAIPTTAAVPDSQPTPILAASPTASPTASPSPTPTIALAAPTAAPTVAATTAFKDVPSGTWEAPFVTALGGKKLLSSFADGEFKPDELVTRSQFAAMLSQAMGLAADPNGAKAFKDLPPTYWANPMIGSAIKAGFMRGYSATEFRPDQPIPRHQILIALASGLKLQPPADVPGVINRYKDSKDLVKYAVGRVAAATEASLVVNPTALDRLEPNRPATRGESAAMIHQALVNQGKFPAIDSAVIVKP